MLIRILLFMVITLRCSSPMGPNEAYRDHGPEFIVGGESNYTVATSAGFRISFTAGATKMHGDGTALLVSFYLVDRESGQIIDESMVMIRPSDRAPLWEPFVSGDGDTISQGRYTDEQASDLVWRMSWEIIYGVEL